MESPIIYPQPYDGTDLLWELLSIFTLPIEDQIVIIGGLTDDENKVKDKMFVSNSLLLRSALGCRKTSWVDHFEFLYDREKEDFSEIQESFMKAINDLNEVCTYKKDYIESKEWNFVRSIGLEILERSGLPPNPTNVVINFDNYLEVVIDPNHGLICINC